MEIRIVCCGRIREKYLQEAAAEYIKMTGRFCKVDVIELADEPLTGVKSAADEKKVLEKEAAKIRPHLKGYVIATDVQGRKMDSFGFSDCIRDIFDKGNSCITFVIGSSMGLSEDLKNEADLRVSFSDMTMPHRLFRVVLLEQIFRAFKIMNGETYQK